MAAPQTAVSEAMAIGFAGALADSGNKTCASKYSEEASAEIPFGVMVVKGTDEDNGVLLPHTSGVASADIMMGVVVHSHAYAKDTELGDSGLKPKVSLDVLTHGRIYVLPEETVTPGDPVRVRVIAAGLEQKGAFRTTADSTDCVDISSFARWTKGGSSTVPAVLELDMTYANGVQD